MQILLLTIITIRTYNKCYVLRIMASPQQSGYQCQFVDSVRDCECPVCLSVTREPFLTSCCGQHFCQVCISRIFTDNKPCPYCKESSFTTLLDKKQKRKVLSLTVYCKKNVEGCQWVGGLKELENHLCGNCQFVEVNCPNNCGWAIQRQLLAKHQTNDCPERLYSCQYCHLEGTYQEIQDNHPPVCPKYPVTCPNQCGVSPLERDQVKNHFRECPLHLVECELREMGCEEMVKRKDLVRHMEEGTQKHLTLMASKYLKTQASVQERFVKLERENEDLKKKLLETQSELREQRAVTMRKDNQVMSDLRPIQQYLRTSTSYIHVNFTKQKKSGRWENYATFSLFPSKCVMKANLYSEHSSRLDIELTHVPSSVDDSIQWPKKFTMTVRLINQAGDHDHYQVTQDVIVKRGHFNDDVRIPYLTIKNPPPGVQYVSNGHIKLLISVTET